MSSVDGFDYTTGKFVTMTPAAWRLAYPPATHKRTTTGGETWYWRKDGKTPRGADVHTLVAEAYAVIPPGRSL